MVELTVFGWAFHSEQINHRIAKGGRTSCPFFGRAFILHTINDQKNVENY